MPSQGGHAAGEAPERVGLLMRVSAEEQRDRETVEIQEEFLDQYCRLYELEVADVYKDDGVSGTIPLHERPEGRRLLEDAKAGKFRTVLVQKLASFAEYDRENIREKTQDGLHRAFRNGRHTGRIPYGYDVADGGGFVLVEEEVAVVREIFSNVAGGSTLYRDAQRLNDLGMPGLAGSTGGGRASTRRAGLRPPSASWSTRAPTAGRTWCGSRAARAAWRGSAHPWSR